MTTTKYRLSYDEVRVIVIALVELKNQLIAEGRYTDACLLFRESVGCGGRQRRRDGCGNHAEGCCPGRRGADRSDLPGIEEVAE